MSEIILRVDMIQCSLANAVRHSGDKEVSILPKDYVFFKPCPFGKTRPDSACLCCTNHQKAHISTIEVSEEVIRDFIPQE